MPHDRLNELQHSFFASTALQELHAALLRRNDVDAVKTAAHAVRGTAGILQLREIATVALTVEVWVKDGAAEEQRMRLLERLAETIASARAAVGVVSAR